MDRPAVATSINTCAINIDEPTARSALGVNSALVRSALVLPTKV